MTEQLTVFVLKFNFYTPICFLRPYINSVDIRFVFMSESMSQSRIRKPLAAAAAGDSSPRRGPVAKPLGDPAKPQQPQQSQLNKKNKSRNKIPKSIRHDLENALVGVSTC